MTHIKFIKYLRGTAEFLSLRDVLNSQIISLIQFDSSKGISEELETEDKIKKSALFTCELQCLSDLE